MWLIAILFLAAPAVADGGRSAVSTPRTGPELSDVALFAVAAVAVWLARRALRKRARKG
ncbi:hypothetical protein [uncultured Sphingomonas sp.]|jgi:membrane protein implicated in regulation of membrane protease activity|uniref:hypothetical protein n=1 Tax=unclassified Sphingomonas TaxID=196159 RepID=UPI0025CF649B|nr:hypothetical protein [uncultured Sphingomonas sp.]